MEGKLSATDLLVGLRNLEVQPQMYILSEDLEEILGSPEAGRGTDNEDVSKAAFREVCCPFAAVAYSRQAFGVVRSLLLVVVLEDARAFVRGGCRSRMHARASIVASTLDLREVRGRGHDAEGGRVRAGDDAPGIGVRAAARNRRHPPQHKQRPGPLPGLCIPLSVRNGVGAV
jgi:hypothetical protein